MVGQKQGSTLKTKRGQWTCLIMWVILFILLAWHLLSYLVIALPFLIGTFSSKQQSKSCSWVIITYFIYYKIDCKSSLIMFKSDLWSSLVDKVAYIFILFSTLHRCHSFIFRHISLLQNSESETQRAVQSRNESEESSWPQSDQEKERNNADVVETAGGEWHYLVGCLKNRACLLYTHNSEQLWIMLGLVRFFFLCQSENKSFFRCNVKYIAQVFTPFTMTHLTTGAASWGHIISWMKITCV